VPRFISTYNARINDISLRRLNEKEELRLLKEEERQLILEYTAFIEASSRNHDEKGVQSEDENAWDVMDDFKALDRTNNSTVSNFIGWRKANAEKLTMLEEAHLIAAGEESLRDMDTKGYERWPVGRGPQGVPIPKPPSALPLPEDSPIDLSPAPKTPDEATESLLENVESDMGDEDSDLELLTRAGTKATRDTEPSSSSVELASRKSSIAHAKSHKDPEVVVISSGSDSDYSSDRNGTVDDWKRQSLNRSQTQQEGRKGRREIQPIAPESKTVQRLRDSRKRQEQEIMRRAQL
jgi:hypothetical protein